MARPLSEEKREAILAAATDLVAAQGTSAPTAQIAKRAGVAEGTLFIYFATKDDLLNQLYLDIKSSLGAAILRDYPAQGSVRDRSRHLWDRFIDWGADQPVRRKAMRQLAVSDRVTQASRTQANAAFRDLNAMLEEKGGRGLLEGLSPAFLGALLEAIAEVTLEFIAREPGKREAYKAAGFEAFWNGVAQ